MSMFTLAIFCLTTFNLLWFTDLTFQVPIHYCSLQHQTLLPSPAHPQLGIVFILAQPLHSFWSYFSTLLQRHIGHLPTRGVHLSGSYLFCFFILFMGFSRQEYWSGLPLPSPVDHVLSELSTMLCPFWVALDGTALSPEDKVHSYQECQRLDSPDHLWLGLSKMLMFLKGSPLHETGSGKSWSKHLISANVEQK